MRQQASFLTPKHDWAHSSCASTMELSKIFFGMEHGQAWSTFGPRRSIFKKAIDSNRIYLFKDKIPARRTLGRQIRSINAEACVGPIISFDFQCK